MKEVYLVRLNGSLIIYAVNYEQNIKNPDPKLLSLMIQKI